MDDQTKTALMQINKLLFIRNMKVIRDLLFVWKEPRNPLNPTGRVTPLDFDLHMVEVEQDIVEYYLTKGSDLQPFYSEIIPRLLQDTTRQALNTFMNARDPLESLRNLELTFLQDYSKVQEPEYILWARQVMDFGNLSFTHREHRIAIGKAIVFQLHNKTLEQYLQYMRKEKSLPPGQVLKPPVHLRIVP